MKKNYESGNGICQIPKKLLLVMKLTAILLVVFTMHVTATVYSQNTKLSLNMQGNSIKEVLQQIEAQSEYRFIYENEKVNLDTKVSIRVKDEVVENILKMLFEKDGVNYSITESNLILINPSDVQIRSLSKELNIIQQQKSVAGKVTDTTGEQLPGVSIVVKGTTKGTITDANGNYSLSNVPSNATLQFSFVGMKTQEVLVEGKSSISIVMTEDAISIDEVVAIGYGTIEKKKLTSSISSIKSEDFVQGALTDAGGLLKGKIAGLTVINANGDPNASSIISLRGINSISLNSSPLILIDGIQGDLNTIAPEDIQSIDVLKDGSAAAIYGTKGTNGVILVTTRQPVGGESTIDFSSYLSYSQVVKKPDVYNADEWLKLIKDGKISNTSDYKGNTNWWNQMTQNNPTQSYNLTLNSGSKTSNFLANINYKKAEGVMLGNGNELLIGRLVANHLMFNNKLKLNLNWNTNITKYPTLGDGYSYNAYFARLATIANPTMPVYKQDGSYAQVTDYTGGFNLYQNPVSMVNETKGDNDSQKNRIYGNIGFTPTNNLKFNTLLSYERFNQVRGYFETFDHPNSTSRDGYGSRGATQIINKVFEFTTEYTKTVAQKHSINAVVGYHYDDNLYENFWMNNYNYPTDQFQYNNMGLGNALSDGKAAMGSYKSSQNLISFFGRVNYDFDNKYLVSAGVRYEGSSKFVGSNKEWGAFPSATLGWRISKESFMKNVKWVNDLKLRAGYGITGNAPDALYRSLYRLNYGSSNNQMFYNGSWVNILEAASNRNPEFTWEKKHEINVGLDYSFLNNRVYGSIDYYKRNTKGMLYEYPVPVPPNTFATTYANVGEMENKGLEIALNIIPIKNNNFQWQSTLLFSTNSNKLVSITNDKYALQRDYFYTGWTEDPVSQYTHIVKVGHPIGEISTWHVVDITPEGKWLIQGADGNPKLQSKATEADRQIVGNGIPKFYAGFNNTIRYKGFDLNVTMRGAFDFSIININRMNYENSIDNGTRNMLRTAYDKVFGKVALNDVRYYNDYYVEKGDYLKVDNIVLGYTFNTTNINWVRNIRIYVSTLNTFVYTGYKGIDPEIGISSGALSPGIDARDKYPSTRTLTFGVNLKF